MMAVSSYGSFKLKIERRS